MIVFCRTNFFSLSTPSVSSLLKLSHPFLRLSVSCDSPGQDLAGDQLWFSLNQGNQSQYSALSPAC